MAQTFLSRKIKRKFLQLSRLAKAGYEMWCIFKHLLTPFAICCCLRKTEKMKPEEALLVVFLLENLPKPDEIRRGETVAHAALHLAH